MSTTPLEVGRGLYAQRLGSGSDLVLVHGWGMHGGVWGPLTCHLLRDCRLHVVDLPGYGRSAPAAHTSRDLRELARKVVEHVPPGAVWLGWSLGGMVAMQAAIEYPDRVRALILVATTPRFVCDVGWPQAMDSALLQGFAQQLEQDWRGTLNRFLALETAGGAGARDTLRGLRACLFERGEPHPAALAAGLEILSGVDMRARLGAIGCPILFIHGGRDRIVPVAAADTAARMAPNACVHVIPAAAHAPFLSHTDEFLTAVRRFLAALDRPASAPGCG